jgi:hypothetical protein
MMRVILPGGTPEFVGFVANVQTPLEYQDYSPSSSCISRWVLFVPPENPPPKLSSQSFEAVLNARRPFKDWIASFKQICPACVIDNEGDFEQWLGQSGPRESQAIVILSHHSANALYFSEAKNAPHVLSSAVSGRFASPSLVILDACGTSEPGVSEFLREFNFRGVSSAIATSVQVDPVLAGKFLDTLMRLLQKHMNDEGYTIDRARFDAVRALGRAPDAGYGATALAFVLAGNGALRLCVPQDPALNDQR